MSYVIKDCAVVILKYALYSLKYEINKMETSAAYLELNWPLEPTVLF